MNAAHAKPAKLANRDLEQIIEPLASYICATEQPKAVLLSALVTLVRAVRETNQTARSHFHNFPEVQWS